MNNYLILILLMLSCGTPQNDKIKFLKIKEKKLSKELDSLQSINQDIKYAVNFKGIADNDTVLYNKNSEKYLNYPYPELYFNKFFIMAFVNEYSKAYNDISRLYIDYYGDKLFLEKYKRVKYYCLYNLAKSFELGNSNTKEQFNFFKIKKQDLKSSKFYFLKTFAPVQKK